MTTVTGFESREYVGETKIVSLKTEGINKFSQNS